MLYFSKSKIINLVGNIKKFFKESDNHLSIGILENGLSVRFLGSSSQEARKCFFVFGNKLGLFVDSVSQNIKVYGLYKIL